MRLVYDWLFTVLWVAFLVYWQVMAAFVKKTKQLEPLSSRAVRVALFGTAIYLLAFRPPAAWLHVHLWPSNFLTFWTGAALTLAGLLFCVWARVTLGRNWSRSVTIKEDHELIESGPYGMVRHPIYSGLFLGFIGSVLAEGQVRGVVAFGLVFVSLWLKLRLEEKWMRAQFGAKYEAYAGRVKAVVPGVV